MQIPLQIIRDSTVTHPSIQSLQLQAAGLLFYQTLWQDPVGQAFLQLLQIQQPDLADPFAALTAYGNWFSSLAETGLGWQEWLLQSILQTDNPFTQRSQQVDSIEQLPTVWIQAAQQDLRSLQLIYQHSDRSFSQMPQWQDLSIDLSIMQSIMQSTGQSTGQSRDETAIAHCFSDLPRLPRLPIVQKLIQADDWSKLLPDLVAHYRQTGIGIFARYLAFRWQSGELQGIAAPDPIPLAALVGYELPKSQLIQNTEALLKGLPALHVLLYGSRGTGKSSLVKALLTDYAVQGLRLVEVGKSDLSDLPTIVDRLRHLPQKFIIFVDDLSFEEDDDTYKSLKVVLEGSLTARSPNLVVYATSNRRHLIREFYGDRPRPKDADEIHAWDTMQEKLSFSDRFGLTLTFEPADQEIYLAIVFHLAQRAGITLASDVLQFRALQWAITHNGRSGRTARQFVDFLRVEGA